MKKRAAIATISVLGTLVAMATADSRPTFSSWHIYWDTKKVDPASQLYSPKLNQLCAFGVHFDTNGHLTSAFPSLSNTLTQLRKNAPQAKILLTAVNDVADGSKTKLKDAAVIHDIVVDPSKSSAHIRELMTLAAPFDGIEIDYESLNASDRDNFSLFIEELAKEVHAQKKILSVVSESKTAESKRNGSGAMDWKRLSEAADVIKIMAYYLHFPSGTPGPVAPTEWVEQITTFALTQIPKEKLTIALVMNGVDWSDKNPGKPIDFETVRSLVQKKKVKIKREKGSPYFSYKDGDAQHLVWFEDEESLNAKLKMLKKAGVSFIALWRLGSGDPNFWNKL